MTLSAAHSLTRGSERHAVQTVHIIAHDGRGTDHNARCMVEL